MNNFGITLENKIAEFGSLCVGIDPSETELNNWGLEDTAHGAKEYSLRCIDRGGRSNWNNQTSGSLFREVRI